MTVEELCVADLQKLEQHILTLSPKNYFNNLGNFEDRSISEITGLICNFYLQLLQGAENGLVCYEHPSDIISKILSDQKFAIYTLSKIQANIPKKIKNFPMNLKRINPETNETIALVSTTYCRELLFCLESSLKLRAGLYQVAKTGIQN